MQVSISHVPKMFWGFNDLKLVQIIGTPKHFLFDLQLYLSARELTVFMLQNQPHMILSASKDLVYYISAYLHMILSASKDLQLVLAK